MVLFLNGVPIFTAELKNPLTGQTVEDAIRQYKTDRDPRELLLAYGRCLAHFAVAPELVYRLVHRFASGFAHSCTSGRTGTGQVWRRTGRRLAQVRAPIRPAALRCPTRDENPQDMA